MSDRFFENSLTESSNNKKVFTLSKYEKIIYEFSFRFCLYSRRLFPMVLSNRGTWNLEAPSRPATATSNINMPMAFNAKIIIIIIVDMILVYLSVKRTILRIIDRMVIIGQITQKIKILI